MAEVLTRKIANEYRDRARLLPPNGLQDIGDRRKLRCRKAFYSVHNLQDSCKLNMGAAEHLYALLSCLDHRQNQCQWGIYVGEALVIDIDCSL